MASRSLDDLEPNTRSRAQRFVSACTEAGLDVLIYCTLRSHAEQDALYGKGIEMPEKIVHDLTTWRDEIELALVFWFIGATTKSAIVMADGTNVVRITADA